MTEDPFAAHSSAPSINKIPFLVFDAILVFTAVMLALFAGGPLSPLLFFWILLCVVVGGLVGCLPFWIEFRDKVRLSEYEIRERQNSIHDSQWQYVDARLVEQNEYLQKLHLRLSESAERLAAIEARPPTPTADEVAALCSGALQKQWPDWREELLSVLSRRTDILFNEQNAQSAKLSASHEKQLGELRTEFTSIQTVLRGLEMRVSEIALLSTAGGATLATQHRQATTQNLSATPPPATNSPSATPPSSAGDSDFAATQTTVEGAAQSPEAKDTAPLPTEPEAVKNPTTQPQSTEHPPTQPEAVTTQPEAIESPPAQPETVATQSETVATQSEGIESPPAQPEDTAQEPAPLSPQTPPAIPAHPIEATRLETPAQPTSSPKAPLGEKTALIAQVLIGIGNKPYVRGIGPGLSPLKGVPMQFVEIGKWQWVCPSGTVPVKIQIYKNDEIPSTLGEIELEPGQRKAVTPTFES